MALSRNEIKELTFMRALYSALAGDSYIGSYVEQYFENEDKSIVVVATPPEEIGSGRFVSAIVLANIARHTTKAYFEIFEADRDDAKSRLKDIIEELVGRKKSRAAKVVIIDNDSNSTNKFRTSMMAKYNETIDDNDSVFMDAFSDAAQRPFKILASITKETIKALGVILTEEMDEDDYEHFSRSTGRYSLRSHACSKDRRTFTFTNGIVLTVIGFSPDEDEDLYEDIESDVSYAIKREVKNDTMF